MKQFFAIVLTLVMVCTLCACGRKPAETTPTTMPATTTATTPSTTAQTTLPIMDPTLETNIPDPSVDTSMPDATDMLPTDGATNESTDPTTNGSANAK